MKSVLVFAGALACLAVLAERQPLDRYQSIIDRQMFGQPPPNFDPTVPASSVARGGDDEVVLTREQEELKSAIHFSAINVTPEGETAVGFTDNSDPKAPVHYYLKVGETRNGWNVVEADPLKATMRIVKGGIDVALTLGDNSAGKGGAKGRIANIRAAGDARRPAIGGRLSRGGNEGANAAAPGSLRERRAALRERERQEDLAREKEREALRERERQEDLAREKEREAQAAADREEMRNKLQLLKAELEAQRAERAAGEKSEKIPADENAENDD